MRALLIVWPYWPFFWAVVLWAYLPESGLVTKGRKGAAEAGSQDAGSIRVIMIGGMLSMLAAIPLAWRSALRVPASLNLPIYAAGVVMIALGSLLRRHCFRQLGASFTGDVRVSADQRVITTGAYAWLRHPSYTAGIIMNTGVGLALGSWASTLVLLVASFAVYVYRIQVEERALVSVIGEPYRQFMSKRKRLVPFIY